MYSLMVMLTPVDHAPVDIGQGVAYIHDDDQTPQIRPVTEIIFHQLLPALAYGHGDLGITVAGQVNQSALIIQIKKINQLGTAGGFTGSSQIFVLAQGIERTGFAGIGAAGKGHFGGAIGGKLGSPGGADVKKGTVIVIIHRRMVTGVQGVSNQRFFEGACQAYAKLLKCPVLV